MEGKKREFRKGGSVSGVCLPQSICQKEQVYWGGTYSGERKPISEGTCQAAQVEPVTGHSS